MPITDAEYIHGNQNGFLVIGGRSRSCRQTAIDGDRNQRGDVQRKSHGLVPWRGVSTVWSREK